MKQFQLLIKSFRHYFAANLWVALGVAITTMVLTGALIVGDSVKHSLYQTANLRLGNISHSLTSGDRYFTRALGEKLNEQAINTSSALKLEASVSSNGGQLKLSKVDVWGVDKNFGAVTANNSAVLGENSDEAVSISKNVATRLNLNVGDDILLRVA